MATKDYITPEYKLAHRGVICLEEFYRTLRTCLNHHKYDIFEKEYKTLKTEDGDVINTEPVDTMEKVPGRKRVNRLFGGGDAIGASHCKANKGGRIERVEDRVKTRIPLNLRVRNAIKRLARQTTSHLMRG